MNTTQQRVFVSSVIDGFEDFRAAARRAIEDAGGEPVLVNEDAPSTPASSRNLCLDLVESCDVFILLLDRRGGWIAPSGRLVVEEEFEHAKRCRLPILAFLRDGSRDAAANALAARVSDYVDGLFRQSFQRPEELTGLIREALNPMMHSTDSSSQRTPDIAHYLDEPLRLEGRTCLRLVIAPERREEVFGPVQLESDDFRNTVYRLGHDPATGLFSYEIPKHHELALESLIVEQQLTGREHYQKLVRLEITEAGFVIVDANVTGRTDRSSGTSSMMDMFVIPEEDVEAVAASVFRFGGALYAKFDPHKRHSRFFFNAALSNVEHRRLERGAVPSNQYSTTMIPTTAAVSVMDSPRALTRSELDSPADEIERLLARFRRRLEPAKSPF